MRYLSLWQPWASLMACGAKKIETRSWPTSFRGLVGIHAAKSRDELDWCDDPPFRAALTKGGIRVISDLPFGALLAIGMLHDCVLAETALPQISDEENVFGNYEPGRFAWRFSWVRALPEPIPWRGMQGLWTDSHLDARLSALPWEELHR